MKEKKQISRGSLTPIEKIEGMILFIRGKKVMLDRDLALLYVVPTKRLNEQVKRNIKRFPTDFMFQLTDKEKEEVVANCDHLKILKFSSANPYVFTQEGVAMLSSVLNSERAIEVNIQIMRVFIKLREIMMSHKDLIHKIEGLERKFKEHDKKFVLVFEAIRQLLTEPEEPSKEPIGFRVHK
ncbi:MAG: ORF6N domain-containing protein [Candidatus Omnitrophica bacterium]|nr:ORF6N domain-containing protein [Candidatus Omnitrophota bacterium]